LKVPCRCGFQTMFAPQVSHKDMRYVNAFVSLQISRHLPARPVRQTDVLGRTHPADREDPRTYSLIMCSRFPRMRYPMQALNTGLRIPHRPQSGGLIRHTRPVGDLNRGMAIIPPQHQSGPQSEHDIHRLIPRETVQFVTLISRQNATLSRHDEMISWTPDQQDATRLRHTSPLWDKVKR
jgi:hypothetical protein